MHYAAPQASRTACGMQVSKIMAETNDSVRAGNWDIITCLSCLAARPAPLPLPLPTPREKMRRDWTVAAVGGDTDLGFEDWAKGVGTPTPFHKPPRMEDDNGLVDGVFTFHDVHLTGNEMEVVPQQSGNVEITIGDESEGKMFTLSHLDRADMLRALLHDFHYSPERGGPSDDNN